MSTLKIVVKNSSSEAQQFLIFNDQPTFSASVGKAWFNVWGCSPGTGAKGGTTQFDITDELFAVCGMNSTQLATDLLVSTTDSVAVKLGIDNQPGTDVPLISEKGGVSFNKDKLQQLKKEGSYGIRSGSFEMASYKNAFCGLGRRGPFPKVQEVVPVAVWQAKPNQRYHITPKRVFFIATGKYERGTVVDFAELGTYATIDFTGRSETVATIELDDTLSYSRPDYTTGNAS